MHIPHLFPARHTIVPYTKSMYAFALPPLAPACWVFSQHLAGESPITRRILHVDMQIGAFHCNDDVEVYLQVVRDALLDGEGLGGVAIEPAHDF